MNRKELMKMIALATGISVAGAIPVSAADLDPELGIDDPLILEPAAGPGPSPGPGPGGGGGGFEGY